MKIINKTRWQTRDLRRIAARVVREEFPRARFGDAAKHYVVEVCYARGAQGTGSCSGFAQLHGRHCQVNVPGDYVDPVDFAHVVAHECGHSKGLRHGAMPPHMESTHRGKRSNYMRQHFAWAVTIVIRKRSAKAKPRPGVDAKLTHASLMWKRAQTRLKRAQALERQWRQKVKYYTRRWEAAAACPKERDGQTTTQVAAGAADAASDGRVQDPS